MLKFIKAEPLPGYRLHLVYMDGVTGDVDLSHLVGKGVFRLWADPSAFAHVAIGSDGEVRWSDDVDLCPDALYMAITGKRADEMFPNLHRSFAVGW